MKNLLCALWKQGFYHILSRAKYKWSTSNLVCECCEVNHVALLSLTIIIFYLFCGFSSTLIFFLLQAQVEHERKALDLLRNVEVTIKEFPANEYHAGETINTWSYARWFNSQIVIW